MTAERLQKVMAAAGVGSRRLCETLIVDGRVQVNGKTVTELGAKADPARDRIVVDGKRLEFQSQHVYYKVHKPRGVISDIGGEEVDLRTGELRKTVADLLPADHARVFPVGRLDLHSEGLVLLTDDGELANRLTHPRYQHPKAYYVLLGEQPTQEALVQLRNGVDLPEGRSGPAEVMIVSQLPATLRLSKGPNEGVWLRVVLREGKKRQIRHMTAAVGYPTLRLLRWSIGPLTLGNLELGQSAPLTLDEINALRRMAGMPPIAQPRPSRGRSPGTRPPGRRGSADEGEPRRPASRRAGAEARGGEAKAAGPRSMAPRNAAAGGAPPKGTAPKGAGNKGSPPKSAPARSASSRGEHPVDKPGRPGRERPIPPHKGGRRG